MVRAGATLRLAYGDLVRRPGNLARVDGLRPSRVPAAPAAACGRGTRRSRGLPAARARPGAGRRGRPVARDLARIVTAFTVAHSITLGLAATGTVRLPPQ